jgi:hypothetical protein
MQKINGLEIDQDMRHQERAYIVKRVMMLSLFVILILALAGFTGDGPVSKEVAGSSSDVLVVTQKFARYESPLKVDLLVNTMSLNTADSMLDISFPNTYIHNFRIQSVLPEPDHTEISHNSVIYRFNIKDPGEAQRIVFHLRPCTFFKKVEGTIRVGERSEVRLKHFIYP